MSNQGADPREFMFVDESGDPGPLGSDKFILVGVHLAEEALIDLRAHITNFRYHHGIRGELKARSGVFAGVAKHQFRGFVKLLEKMTAGQLMSASGVWIDKTTYKAGGGKYLGYGKDTFLFRNYMLKRLLRTHAHGHTWGNNLDLVIDRYDLPQGEEGRARSVVANTLGTKTNPVRHMTFADSSYVGMVQLADIYARIAKTAIAQPGSEFERASNAIMNLREVVWGKP